MSAKTSKEENVIVPKGWWESLPRKVYSTLQWVKTSQPWFEVYKLNEKTWAIYEPYQFEETLSYLVEGDKKAVLIDTGDGIGDIKKLCEELTKLPFWVVNTHTHVDHVAQNYMFKDVWCYDGPMAMRWKTDTRTADGANGPGMTWKNSKSFDVKKVGLQGDKVAARR
jgi:glyoxylase-like metal-dependent hydrolase (beta-lactamase superfamily II)